MRSAGDNEGGGGVKSRKKNLVFGHDEYSIDAELSAKSVVREEKVAPLGDGGGKKKDKKRNSKKVGLKDDDDEEEQLEEKNVDEEDDEAEVVMQFAGKKKGKGKKGATNKGNSVFSSLNFGLLGDEDSETEVSDLTQSGDRGNGASEDDGENVVAFSGRKKPMKSKRGGCKSSFSAAAFGAIGNENDEVGGVSASGKLSYNDDEPVIAFSGKKKPSKSGKKCGGCMFTASALSATGDEDDGGLLEDLVSGQQSDNEEPLIEFSGKKKPSKSGKKGGDSLFSASSFDGLQDGENKESKEEDEEVASVTFRGKKKKSSKSLRKNSTNSFNAALLDEETNGDVSASNLGREPAGDDTSALDELDTSVVTFSGKKKSSKKKITSALTAHDAGLGDKSSVVVELDQPTLNGSTKELTEDDAETSKNKKKKKKSGRTAQEEEDLDKFLAELGEAPLVSKTTPTPILMEPTPKEKVHLQPELENGTGPIFYNCIS